MLDLSIQHNKTLVFRVSPERRTLLLILFALALRFVFAASTGLGVDEAYTVATSRVLALSTFDHPPMTWWIVHFTALALGEGDMALRLPFLLLFVLATWLMFVLTRRLFSAEAGFFAAFALNLSPMLGLTDASWIVPDAPLAPAMLGCAYALSRVFFDEERRSAPLYWLLAAVCAGLAMLSKYHGVLLFAGAGLFMLASPRQRHWLATPWPWLAALVAVLIFSPVLIWNAHHDWVSFVFQRGRGGAPGLRLLAPLALIGLQSLWVAPWLYFPLAALFIRAFLRGAAQERDFFLACLAGALILPFTVIALWSSAGVMPHWALPGYLLLFPLLGREIAHRFWGAPWLRNGLLAASAFMVIGIGIVAILPYQHFEGLSGRRYPLFELLDWDDLGREFARRGLAAPGQFVAATRWLDAGKIDSTLAGVAPVICLNLDPRGFGLRNPEKFIGHDGLVITSDLSFERAKLLLSKYFDTMTEEAPIDVMEGGKVAIHFRIIRVTNFHDLEPEFSLRPAINVVPGTGMRQ
jgi:hypothetical protein